MHNQVMIENHVDMVRDMTSHAVISNSKNKILDYEAKKLVAKQRMAEIRNQEEQINSLRNEIASIKDMLTSLMQR